MTIRNPRDHLRDATVSVLITSAGIGGLILVLLLAFAIIGDMTEKSDTAANQGRATPNTPPLVRTE